MDKRQERTNTRIVWIFAGLPVFLVILVCVLVLKSCYEVKKEGARQEAKLRKNADGIRREISQKLNNAAESRCWVDSVKIMSGSGSIMVFVSLRFYPTYNGEVRAVTDWGVKQIIGVLDDFGMDPVKDKDNVTIWVFACRPSESPTGRAGRVLVGESQYFPYEDRIEFKRDVVRIKEN